MKVSKHVTDIRLFGILIFSKMTYDLVGKK